MAGKPFLLFGRSSSPEEKAQELESRISGKLKEVDAELSEKKIALAAIKRESTNVVSQARRHSEKLKSEELALKALRDEAAKRIKSAEEKMNALALREKSAGGMEARVERMKREEERLSASIDQLEHAFAEKKRAVDERQKAIMSLTKELNSLLQKRAEVRRLEANMVAASEKEKKMKLNVEKMERRVADGESIVRDQAVHIERNKKILDRLTAQVSEMNVLKRKFDAEMADRQKAMLAAKRELADMEAAVQDVMSGREQLERKSALLTKRERQLSEQESRMDQKKRELEKLRFDAEAAEKSKQQLAGFLEDKRHVLAELKSAIAQNGQTIRELHEHETNARRGARDLEIAQRAADKKLKLLEEKERDLIRRETAFVEHDKALKDAAVALSKDKKELMEEVNARKAELLLVKQEWEKRFEDLGQEKKDLQVEKSDVRSLVESDVLALKDKEDELVTAIAMFERDRDKLQDEEKRLLKRVAQLERAKAEFEREVKILTTKEKRVIDGERVTQKGMKYIEVERKKLEQEKDKVYRARELKRILPQLERRYEELRRTMGKVEARAIGIGTRPPASRLLKEREKAVEEREEGIHVEMRKLMEREHEVEGLESRKERAFSEYLREEVERARMGKPGKEIMNPEIHAMIDDARERVMQGKLDEAVRLVAEAEYLVDKVPNMNEKRLLMYDIRDLKASIKLATLT